MKKIFIILVSLIILTACTSTRYTYYPVENINDKISISGGLVNTENENSPLDYIRISDRRSHVGEPHNIKILSPTIKILSNSKEYIIATTPNSKNVHVYKQGVIIIGDFKAYIGKVQLDDGTIIDIPPLLFKKHVYVESYNPVTDTINAGARTKKIFSGTAEEYKKQKK